MMLDSPIYFAFKLSIINEAIKNRGSCLPYQEARPAPLLPIQLRIPLVQQRLGRNAQIRIQLLRVRLVAGVGVDVQLDFRLRA